MESRKRNLPPEGVSVEQLESWYLLREAEKRKRRRNFLRIAGALLAALVVVAGLTAGVNFLRGDGEAEAEAEAVLLRGQLEEAEAELTRLRAQIGAGETALTSSEAALAAKEAREAELAAELAAESAERERLSGQIFAARPELAFLRAEAAITPKCGDYYHHYGCARIGTKSRWILDTKTAGEWGYKPCPDCWEQGLL
jgi:hypothetical protein